MKKFRLLLSILTLVACQHVAAGGEFTIEDKDLKPLEGEIDKAVLGHKSFIPLKSISCHLVGKSAKLSNNREYPGYFVTTADACGWGAALGPIWLVLKTEKENKVVLNTGGYVLNVTDLINSGMYNVTVSNGTANGDKLVVYKFNGVKYKPNK